MDKIGIYYGSSTDNTKDVAYMIAGKLGVDTADIHDVGAAASKDFSAYEVLIFGSSTMGIGDLQDDWEGFVSTLKSANLEGKKVAIFGCGDSISYSDSFCDAIGKIYNIVKAKGCTVIGQTPVTGYSFDASEAVIDGEFAGLPIDADNEPNKTEGRVSVWVELLRKSI